MKDILDKINPFKRLFKTIEPNKKTKQTALNPVGYNTTITDRFSKKIKKVLEEYLFSEIMEVLREYNAFSDDVANSEASVVRAIQESKITYTSGGFKSNFKDGKFPIHISKTLSEIGGKFNKRSKSFTLGDESFTKEMRDAVTNSVLDNLHFTQKLTTAIAKVESQTTFDDLFAKAGFASEYENILKDTLNQIKKNSIEIPIEFNAEQNAKIVKDYTENLKLTIKDFTDQETIKLRKLVEESTQAGFRPQVLAKNIKERFNVTDSKAQFLASQETRLLTTKYAELKFTENNIITKFRWGRSVSRVRDPLHEEHYDKIYSYNNLPVIDEKGTKGLPGERYNCKCRQIPIIEELL